MIQSFLAKNALVASTILLILILKFHSAYSKPKNNLTGFSMKMIPRDSPESPLYPGNLTETQRLERLVRFTRARAHYVKMSTSNKNKKNSNNIIAPQEAVMFMNRDNFFYVTHLLIGTPPVLVYFMMDTGAGLTWTQCPPCDNCYRQTQSLYDPTQSSSYWKLPCSHFLCNGSPHAPYSCVNNECLYSITYAGGEGPTEGIASVETVMFLLTNGALQAIDGIVFGCSKKNLNFEPFEDTTISGIMGLSWAQDSLVTQLDPYMNNKFSYCLVPYNSNEHGPSALTFGDAIPALMGNVLTTKFVFPPGVASSAFYLQLLDISVGWNKLGFPPGIFDYKEEDGTGGFVIDTGASFSVLNDHDFVDGDHMRNPYKEVTMAFENYYDGLKKIEVEELNILELCYETLSGFDDYVTMTYHLAGGDHIVDGKFVNYFDTNGQYFCVGLVPLSGISILGALHQQHTRFVYDGNNQALQFVPEVCN